MDGDRDMRSPREEDRPVHPEPPVDRTKPGNNWGTYAALIAGAALAVVLAMALLGE